MSRVQISFAYRVVMFVAAPFVRLWGRLEVSGADTLPLSGPTLIIANHDSYWDPVIIGTAGLKRRQICALAKASLWDNKLVGAVLNGMGQIPIQRGRGDTQALDAAIRELRNGTCIGVFPEGTTSRGRVTRARSGAGWLALAVPETKVVCARVTGAVDIVRFPKRPRIRVEFFEPSSGQPKSGESAIAMMKRMIAETRIGAPYEVPGRRKRAQGHRKAIAAAAAEKSAG
ncbi:MAG: lysophospholipid acyltransferase family protein [Jatrophihabitantaceae bacterium]